jgi:hypothetical protein
MSPEKRENDTPDCKRANIVECSATYNVNLVTELETLSTSLLEAHLKAIAHVSTNLLYRNFICYRSTHPRESHSSLEEIQILLRSQLK